jgi:hypothetical protein
VLVVTVAVLFGAALVLVGEVVQRRAARRAPALVPAGSDVPETQVADVGRWPMLAWFGLAAFSVLVPAALANRRPEMDDLAMAVLTLGFAGERAYYLLRRRRSGDGLGLGAEVLSLVVAGVGVLVGLTI